MLSRVISPKTCSTAITPITLANGEQGLLAGGRLVTGLDHPIDTAHRPGALKEMLKQVKSGKPVEGYSLEPLRPEFTDARRRTATSIRSGPAS